MSGEMRRVRADGQLAALGQPYDDQGNYVRWADRCMPGLGWPLVSPRHSPYLDYEYTEWLSTGTIVRRLLSRDRP